MTWVDSYLWAHFINLQWLDFKHVPTLMTYNDLRWFSYLGPPTWNDSNFWAPSFDLWWLGLILISEPTLLTYNDLRWIRFLNTLFWLMMTWVDSDFWAHTFDLIRWLKIILISESTRLTYNDLWVWHVWIFFHCVDHSWLRFPPFSSTCI